MFLYVVRERLLPHVRPALIARVAPVNHILQDLDLIPFSRLKGPSPTQSSVATSMLLKHWQHGVISGKQDKAEDMAAPHRMWQQ